MQRTDRLELRTSGPPAPGPKSPHRQELLELLLGAEAIERLRVPSDPAESTTLPSAELELPPLVDLVATVLALAEGQKRKAILPLASSTAEFALVRRGTQVLVSYYDSGPVPQIFVRDRGIELEHLLGVSAAAASEVSERTGQPALARTAQLVAERARRAVVQPDTRGELLTVLRRGGAATPPSDAPLAFGFTAQVAQGEGWCGDAGTRADVHALLFDGELWAFAHGRRIKLVKGPVFPAVTRMVSAARAIVDAWESQRATHLRLKAGEFGIAVRHSKQGEVSLTLTGHGGSVLTLASLDVPSALLPILRLASELARTVVSSDRAQSKNLRLTALRDEVRALRRIVRAKCAQKSFTNSDPELLRASSVAAPARDVARDSGAREGDAASRLRLSLRWRAEVDGLDAGSTFLCGDRLVIATQRSQLALSRDNGELLWLRQRLSTAAWMAGSALVCVSPDGDVELCDVRDGETYARTRIAPRVGGSMLGVCAGGRSAPPVAVITEGRDRLVAVDVRTGEPRWRFRSRGRGNFRLTRAGRILLVVSGDSTLDAVDVATGEVAWRWSDPGRITLAPVVTREAVIAVSGHAGTSTGALMAFDLFSGELSFRSELERGPLASPIAADNVAVVSLPRGPSLSLFGVDLASGRRRFESEDPGLGEGGSPLVVDQNLVINSPAGSAYAIDLETGALRWQHRMADPMRDDVPRRLEPVLRGGALFVPSASVHVLRPSDGSVVAGPVADGIIPDFMRVDERGWLYLAEESGHIEAYAPAPNLRLVRV